METLDQVCALVRMVLLWLVVVRLPCGGRWTTCHVDEAPCCCCTSNEHVALDLCYVTMISHSHSTLFPTAENVGRACGMDVFLPTYRLLPECTFDDMLWDVALAYSFLVKERKVDAKNIILLGISSGSGLVMRLLQFLSELQRGETLEPPYVAPLLSKDMTPAGAVLMCPFVDYTEPKGSFLEYGKHDLVVNQSVMEVGIPYFEQILGSDENRRRTSPVYRNMQGLPPLCVVVSEHEVVYDQTVLLVNRAREAGVQVTLGVWKFMCHVFCFLSSFVPEGQQSMDFVCDWIKTHGK